MLALGAILLMAGLHHELTMSTAAGSGVYDILALGEGSLQ